MALFKRNLFSSDQITNNIRSLDSRGFSLIECIVAIAIFVLMAGAIYQTFFVLSKELGSNTDGVTISNLASQYLENARNMPYSQIGTIQGNPHGNLPDLPNATTVSVSNTNYKIYYEVTYIDDPADGSTIYSTDPAPDDYKQVKLSVKNLTTGIITNFVTNIVPTGLESMASGGAISISVMDAVGQPVSGASISITNNSISPSVNLNRTTNSSGNWIEVGLPDSANSYHIVATKNGYSSDQTYPVSVGNPNPTKTDATIADGQVTQISFAIDKTSSLIFNTLNKTCGGIAGVGLGIAGAKIIGTPSVLKFNNSYTSNSNGQVTLANSEWDNYTPALTGNTYMIYGSSPIQQINLLPNTTQTFNLILGTKTTNSLLVIVKDSSTGDPIEGASVTLSNIPLSYTSNLITGGSLWSQQYWNAGAGQAAWTNTSKYFAGTNINTTDTPLAIRLVNLNGTALANSGSLESSTFDTGSSDTAYTTLTWQPTSQDPSTQVKFQVATNNDNLTWNYIGPGGAGTYYTSPNTTINASNNGNRYVRYKAYLTTTDLSKNPTITSVGLNYVSGCFTPGQVIFPGITSNANYKVDVNAPGYTTKTVSSLNISGYQTLQVLLVAD
ncbi:MAG: carboxypeptidase regulatory-like domain-containing protein [bacterium]